MSGEARRAKTDDPLRCPAQQSHDERRWVASFVADGKLLRYRQMSTGAFRMKLGEFTAGWAARLAALLVVAAGPASDARATNLHLAFLSGSKDDHQTGAPPQPSPTAFDGRWIFTSAGCKNTGSLPATIKQGRIIVRGGSGQVSPDGTLHSIGAGGGMTLTAEGHLDLETGSGTFDRSDGCSGTWIAIKRH